MPMNSLQTEGLQLRTVLCNGASKYHLMASRMCNLLALTAY